MLVGFDNINTTSPEMVPLKRLKSNSSRTARLCSLFSCVSLLLTHLMVSIVGFWRENILLTAL